MPTIQSHTQNLTGNAKLGTSPYRSGRASSWKKVRHAETTDAAVVGYTGPAIRPRALVVRLPDGRVRLTRAIGAQLAAQVAAQLTLSEPGRTASLGRVRCTRPWSST